MLSNKCYKLFIIEIFSFQPGDNVMILPTLSEEDAPSFFANISTIALPSEKIYLRMTNCDGLVP